jgi:hypothetical protein
MDLVRSVDALRPGMPSLVVCGDSKGWAALSADGLNVEMMPLPVTRPALVTAIERLTRPAPSPHPSHESHSTGPAARRIVAARDTSALRERLAKSSHEHAARQPSTADEEIAQLRPRPEAPAPPVPAAMPSPPPAGPAAALAAPSTSRRASDLARALLQHRHELYDVRDACRAMLDDSVVVTDVLAGVVMLPDDGLWRVCAAVGTRPLEWRYVLEPDSWIVTTVVDGERGVIVEDSDIARQRLGGAPLAHHPLLMILPIPGPRGVVVLARESEPFTETELTSLAAVAAGAGPALSEGLAIRELARSLNEFRGVEE